MESNKKAEPFSKDVISTLPNDLLCHVLTFLTTKDAALTPVLSKRWSNLLQLLPTLDFDDSLLRNPKTGQGQIVVFQDFVDRVLSLRAKNSFPVKKVSLKLRHVGDERVIPWIRNIIDLGALELSLRLDYKSVKLHFNVFSSKALVNLSIGARIHLYQSSPASVSVSPMLNSLVLDSVKFDDDKLGFQPIMSAFPSLQNLCIHESFPWYYWHGSISSPTLKKLVYRRGDDRSGHKTCVSFDTPGLVYLDYSDMVAHKYENMHLDSLVEVKLDLLLSASQIMRKKVPGIGFVSGDVSPLFMAIRNVRILCLSPDALESLYYRGGRSPVFNNLICLTLGSDSPHGSPYVFWKLLPNLLLSSRNLQTLIIKGLVHYAQEGWEGVGLLRISWDYVSDSLSASAVKVLQLTGYKGTSQELKQMKRFLGKLSHLEMVSVGHKAVDDGEMRRLMNDLLRLPKASSICKVKVTKESA